MKEMEAFHKSAIIAIIEPQISIASADEVCKKLENRDWFRIKAKGFNGGIWVLLKKGEVKLKVIHTHKQFIHLSVNVNSGSCWCLTVVYASPLER